MRFLPLSVHVFDIWTYEKDAHVARARKVNERVLISLLSLDDL